MRVIGWAAIIYFVHDPYALAGLALLVLGECVVHLLNPKRTRR